MNWQTKRKVYLAICAVVAMALALVVLILNRDLESDLLAALGIVGGIAILIVSLPDRDGDDGP